jgi:hypothetical protein
MLGDAADGVTVLVEIFVKMDVLVEGFGQVLDSRTVILDVETTFVVEVTVDAPPYWYMVLVVLHVLSP